MHWKQIFLPLSLLYGIGAEIRFQLYNKGVFKRQVSKIPTIVVGNIKVGGTGKSPMIIFLINELHKRGYKVAVLSRGYGRKTKGFLEVQQSSFSSKCGDEPLMIKNRLPNIPVFVSEDRVKGIKEIEKKLTDIDYILLDDAFQHFKLKANLYILLTEYAAPFYLDYPFPAGLLREFRYAANRADCIVTSKTPSLLSEIEISKHLNSIRKYSSAQHFFSYINYCDVINIVNRDTIPLQLTKSKDVVLITGIANPKPILNYLSSNGINFEHHQFKDHEEIKQQFLEKVDERIVFENQIIILTEKDLSRISVKFISNLKNKRSWYYLPIETTLDNGEDYINSIIQKA